MKLLKTIITVLLGCQDKNLIFVKKNPKTLEKELQTYIWKLKAEHVRGRQWSVVDYSIFFLSMSGPTLSPVSSLCFTWDLSQTGN